jgi:Fe-S-cluster containining protein
VVHGGATSQHGLKANAVSKISYVGGPLAKLKLPTFPSMTCEKFCGDCCGPVFVSDKQLKRIQQYIAQHNIVPKDQGLTCPFYQRGVCAIYEVRPRICQAFGHVPKLQCSRGHNVNVDNVREVDRWLLEEGKATKMLHSLLQPNLLKGPQ